jgi:hypothetical protein
LTIATLLLIIAKLLYVPIDKNPTAAEFVEETMLLKNKYGEVLDEIWVGKITVDAANTALGCQWVTFSDVEKNGFNEVFWMQGRTEQTGNIGFVCCKSVRKDSLLWRVPLKRALGFPRKPDVKSDTFMPGSLAVGDFDGDGSSEVFAHAVHDYFPSTTMICLQKNYSQTAAFPFSRITNTSSRMSRRSCIRMETLAESSSDEQALSGGDAKVRRMRKA